MNGTYKQEWHIQTSPYMYLVGSDCVLNSENCVVHLIGLTSDGLYQRTMVCDLTLVINKRKGSEVYGTAVQNDEQKP
jgi:hypothetical protein